MATMKRRVDRLLSSQTAVGGRRPFAAGHQPIRIAATSAGRYAVRLFPEWLGNPPCRLLLFLRCYLALREISSSKQEVVEHVIRHLDVMRQNCRPKTKLAIVMNSVFTPGNAKDGGAETELHAAAWAGNISWAKAALSRGVHINNKDSTGETALHGAAAWGNVEMVIFLLAEGADPNIQEESGLTALHWAVSHGNFATIKVLLDSGADPNLVNSQGLSVYKFAEACGKLEVVEFLRNHG